MASMPSLLGFRIAFVRPSPDLGNLPLDRHIFRPFAECGPSITDPVPSMTAKGPATMLRHG